jgi:hypothetical protein
LDKRTGRRKKLIEVATRIGTNSEGIVARRKSAQSMAMSARIVLYCAQGMSNSAVAEKLDVTGVAASSSPA